MHEVTVKGRILNFDGEAFSKTPVLFIFTGSFTNTNQYPGYSRTAYTDEDGYFKIKLLGNHQGLTNSKYKCKFLNESFDFILPSGVTEVELSALRQGTETPANPSPGGYQSFQYIGENTFQLNQIISNPQGVLVYVNGYKAAFPTDFIIDGSILTWQSSFDLGHSDIIEVYCAKSQTDN